MACAQSGHYPKKSWDKSQKTPGHVPKSLGLANKMLP